MKNFSIQKHLKFLLKHYIIPYTKKSQLHRKNLNTLFYFLCNQPIAMTIRTAEYGEEFTYSTAEFYLLGTALFVKNFLKFLLMTKLIGYFKTLKIA
jgi:hypothetical protein